MSNLNHAQFSSLQNPDETDWENPALPLPASMERHAPGQYQPTLPGMEKMLKGEQTHTSVFFKNPNKFDPELGDIPGTSWFTPKQQKQTPKQVDVPHQSLHPSQPWVDDNYINGPDLGLLTHRKYGDLPSTEDINGETVIHDGHHRIVREMLSGKQFSSVNRWDA